MPATLRFSTLAQAQAALNQLRTTATSETTASRGPALYQVLLHCAQSVEFSTTGYPVMKPALVRATLGRIVRALFLSRGAMRHNLAAPVPGAPALAATGDLESAWTQLFAALTRFESHSGPLRDHFLYGSLTKEQYARVHAMHLADHLSAFS